MKIFFQKYFPILLSIILVLGIIFFLYKTKNNTSDLTKNLPENDIQKIEPGFTDDNSGESVIIKSDQESYTGDSFIESYFSVENTGNQPENFNIQFYFPKSVTVGVQRVEKKTSSGWVDVGQLNNAVNRPDNLTVSKPISNNFYAKDRFVTNLKSGETQYFRAKIVFDEKAQGEFWIEAIGDKGGYGLLDPTFAHVNIRGGGGNLVKVRGGGGSGVSTPGTITRTGSVGVIQNSSNSGSQNVTVPSDATLIVVGVQGYVNYLNYFIGGTITLGGQSLTLGRADLDTTADEDKTAVYYLASASLPTGTQSLAWDWGGTSNFTDGGQIVYAFYKGVDTSNPKKDDGGSNIKGGTNNATISTASMSASSGDMIFSTGYLWNSSTNPTGQTWTNATSVYGAIYNLSRGTAAETFPTGNTSISLANVGGSGLNLFMTLTSVVFRAETISSPSTPGNVKFR